MNLIITVLVILLVAWAAFWVIDRMGLTGTPQLIARVVVGLIALVALLNTIAPGLLHS
jgi:uncharacterized membrane protein (DUF441 family)